MIAVFSYELIAVFSCELIAVFSYELIAVFSFQVIAPIIGKQTLHFFTSVYAAIRVFAKS